jgi:ABC-type polar amino acid transport system ATPase subunit
VCSSDQALLRHARSYNKISANHICYSNLVPDTLTDNKTLFIKKQSINMVFEHYSLFTSMIAVLLLYCSCSLAFLNEFKARECMQLVTTSLLVNSNLPLGYKRSISI